MNVASLDNCKELYELSGWAETEETWYYSPVTKEATLIKNIYKENSTPAYSLKYLVNHLPTSIDNPFDNHWVLYPHGLRKDQPTPRYMAGYDTGNDIKLLQLADTPENALCQLAIELFKAGVLTREEK